MLCVHIFKMDNFQLYLKLLYTDNDFSESVLFSVPSAPRCVATDMLEVWRNRIVRKSFPSSYNNVFWNNMTVY